MQLMNPADIGAHIQDSFQQGQKTRRESETRNALAKFAQNPNDKQAMSEVSRWDPELGIKLQQHNQEMALKQLDGYKDQIAREVKRRLEGDGLSRLHTDDSATAQAVALQTIEVP